jgi:hypothetical protein
MSSVQVSENEIVLTAEEKELCEIRRRWEDFPSGPGREATHDIAFLISEFDKMKSYVKEIEIAFEGLRLEIVTAINQQAQLDEAHEILNLYAALDDGGKKAREFLEKWKCGC